MDSKRKASAASNGAPSAEADDRATKRQRLSEKYNLEKEETAESTTAYGLFFLEQIRRTQDKSGRLIAGYFETLPKKEGNGEYYRKTKMPISLAMVEAKLNKGEFTTLSDLESYFKRMVMNAKEYYPRNSPTFEDAERVRKAVSNFMTKNNPAYQAGNYSAVPTPLPDEEGNDTRDDAANFSQSSSLSSTKGSNTKPTGSDKASHAGKDSVDLEDDGTPENEGSTPARRDPIIIRRASGRTATPKAGTSGLASRSIGRKDNNVYLNVPYEGLNFQEAQEKIVEEMLREKDDDNDGPAFEIFFNLPSRSIKDYYQVIKQPVCLTKLQKQVKGIQGRNEPTWISAFKNWSAFEDEIGLLWKNAYYYNREDSEIYALAQELESFAAEEIKQAKRHVEEPPQPKIKLKVSKERQTPDSGQGSSEPSAPPATKKTIIHVGGRSTSADPGANSVAAQSSEPRGKEIPVAANGLGAQESSAPAAAQKSVTTHMTGSLAPGSAHIGPSAPSGAPVLSTAQFQPMNSSIQVGDTAQKIPDGPTLARRPGKTAADALLSKVRVQARPSGTFDKPFGVTILPADQETDVAVSLPWPQNQAAVQIVLTLGATLASKLRQFQISVLVNDQVLAPAQDQEASARIIIFEAHLKPGIVNLIAVNTAAAIPEDERVPNQPSFDTEQYTVHANVEN